MRKLFLKQNKENGITLIALVITIIVLLILVGITIATLTGENGILSRASEASIQTDIAQTKEQIKLELLSKKANSGTYTKADVVAAVKRVTGNDVTGDAVTVKSKKGNDVNIADLWLDTIDGGSAKPSTTIEASKIEGKNVGDTINWTPGVDTKVSTTSSQSVNGDSDQIIYRQTIEWVLFSKTDATVTLISSENLAASQNGSFTIDMDTGASTGGFILKSSAGWLNAESELNRICNELYGTRSIDIDDINTACGYIPTLREASTTGAIYYPKEGGIETVNDGNTGNPIINLGKGVYTRPSEMTDYYYTIADQSLAVANLFSSNSSCWLASRDLRVSTSNAYFDVRYLKGGGVDRRSLLRGYTSSAYEFGYGLCLRPAVTLTIQ